MGMFSRQSKKDKQIMDLTAELCGCKRTLQNVRSMNAGLLEVQKSMYEELEGDRLELATLREQLESAIRCRELAVVNICAGQKAYAELQAENAELRKENNDIVGMASFDHTELVMLREKYDRLLEAHDRLEGMLTDTEVLKMELENRQATIDLKPKEWIAQFMVGAFAKLIGDSENFVVITVGDEEFGHFEVTVKRFYGKSPVQLHVEELAEKDKLIHDLESDLRLVEGKMGILEEEASEATAKAEKLQGYLEDAQKEIARWFEERTR